MEKIVFMGGVFLFLVVILNSLGTSVPVGTVTIHTEPAGAIIIIDDVPRDVSPSESSIPSGYHTLMVTKIGYKTYTSNFTLSSGEERTIRVTLQKN